MIWVYEVMGVLAEVAAAALVTFSIFIIIILCHVLVWS